MTSSRDILKIEDAPQQERESATRPDAASGAVQQVIVRQGPGWQTTALLFLTMLLLTTVAVAFYAFHRVGILNDEMGDTMRRVEQKIQNLDAGISFDSRRQQLLLGIRDGTLARQHAGSRQQRKAYLMDPFIVQSDILGTAAIPPSMFLYVSAPEDSGMSV